MSKEFRVKEVKGTVEFFLNQDDQDVDLYASLNGEEYLLLTLRPGSEVLLYDCRSEEPGIKLTKSGALATKEI